MADDKTSIPEDLLAEVLARPDETAPREACAAALEKTDPDRAELIRIQLALASRLHGDRTPTVHTLEYREEDLLERRTAEWAGRLQRWMPDREGYQGPGFVRGFIEYLAMSADEFFAQVARLRLEIPLRHVDIVGHMDAQKLRRLLSGAELSGLQSLLIQDAEVTAEGIEALAGSPHVSGLGWFSYQHGKIGSRGILAMASSALLPSLWYFDPGDPDDDHRMRYQDDQGVPVGTEEPDDLLQLEAWYGTIPWLRPAWEDSGLGIDHARRVLGKDFYRKR